MTQDEIAVMDGGKCILQLRGVRPFLSDKYDITKHPNYKYLSDFDKKNALPHCQVMNSRKRQPKRKIFVAAVLIGGLKQKNPRLYQGNKNFSIA